MNKNSVKVVEIFYNEKDRTGSQTGLFLRLENGVVLAQQNTDVVMPYEVAKQFINPLP